MVRFSSVSLEDRIDFLPHKNFFFLARCLYGTLRTLMNAGSGAAFPCYWSNLEGIISLDM